LVLAGGQELIEQMPDGLEKKKRICGKDEEGKD